MTTPAPDLRDDLAESEPVRVLDLAAFRQKRKGSDGGVWRFRRTSEGFVLALPGGSEAVWSDDSAEEIARWVLAHIGTKKRAAHRKQAEIDLPAIRAAMNDAIVASRSGGRDVAAERRAERLRSDWTVWGMLTARERGRWCRLMRKRRP